MAALLCRIADSQEPRLIETQQTCAFFFPPAGIDDEVCIDLFPEGQSCSLGEVQLWLAKEDVEDKGQLSRRTHGQVMAADAGGSGRSKQTSVNRPGGPFCPGCAVWFTLAQSATLVRPSGAVGSLHRKFHVVQKFNSMLFSQ